MKNSEAKKLWYRQVVGDKLNGFDWTLYPSWLDGYKTYKVYLTRSKRIARIFCDKDLIFSGFLVTKERDSVVDMIKLSNTPFDDINRIKITEEILYVKPKRLRKMEKAGKTEE